MTYIFSPMSDKFFVSTEAPEWKAKFPYVGEVAKKTTEVVDAWRSGKRPSLPDEMPKLLIAKKPRKTWPDAFMTTNGLLVVRGSVRQVIERLDPDVHQFFPLIFQTKRKLKIEGPWFAMNVSAKQNSVVVEQSRVLIDPKYPDILCSFSGTSKSKDVIVDPSRQSGLNLWREARFISSLLGSDDLIQELEAQKLRFFPGYYRATDFVETELP